MKDIPDKSIDMILCDLPYGTTACKWDVVIPFEPLWEQYKRIIKDRGCIALFGSEPFSSHLRMSNIKDYKYDWTTIKSKPTGHLNAKIQPLRTVESISVFYNKQCNFYPQDLKPCFNIVKRTNRGNYGECSKTTVQKMTGYPVQHLEINSIDGEHNTQKPVALLEYLIKTYTLEGETVLDNCMGSGSTGVACKNLNRDFIGIEKDATYFELAKNRIENHIVQQELL